MQENLNITLIQPEIIWENPLANLEKYTNWLKNIELTDVVVLPEMFSTGFTMQSEKFKETMDGPSVSWMTNMAMKKEAAIVGSLIIEEDNKIFNRAIWAFPDGTVATYDKRHLYTMGQEHMYYTPGMNKVIVVYKGWKFCPQICYDLRFPVFARNTEDYDVVLYMANWPSPRHHAWKNLLISRAIENQSYCFGINRTGKDGNGLTYLGDSGMVNSRGFEEFLGEKEIIRTFKISYSELQQFRKSFPLLKDRDRFKLV